jgi:hypothetical protein
MGKVDIQIERTRKDLARARAALRRCAPGSPGYEQAYTAVRNAQLRLAELSAQREAVG